MTTVEVRCELDYQVLQPSSVIFAVLAAHSSHQTVLHESLRVEPEMPVQRVMIDTGPHEIVRVSADPGRLSLVYEATVRLDEHVADATPAGEVPFGATPAEVLAYLNPSRYCESDKLSQFAAKTFGGLPQGFERVTGICNWIYDHLDYTPGSTGPSTTAIDVLVQTTGVCRDYAHLGIAFCRALGIPARYVSGYAVDLNPPDFHGFFEAYLDHRWYLFDATRMAPVDRLVRIASGRDAADAAFASSVGAVLLDRMLVSAVDSNRVPIDPADVSAVSTA